MLFNSLSFLVFFPLVTLAYFLLPHRARWAMLLAASCLFYMAFVPKYILILATTIVVDYFAGILIEKATGARRRWLLVVSIICNVGFLFFFKYWGFATQNLQHLANFIHWNYSIPALRIILPIGLSFHTFQAMSYTIEVYRGNWKAERHFGIYALYVMFYPQLVAGPIERPQNLLPQFHTPHSFDYNRFTSGLQRMLWGMFKKVVIADNLAAVVDKVYDHPAQQHGLSFAIATIFFSYQIYCDFSGYVDIALGAAEVMGFRLMENFNQPYLSRSVSEFWKRWHISLSSWFRDYLYIPLGGNRVAPGRWYFNLFFVFLVSGFWHGAKWTFIIWGALHGLYLLISIWTRGFREHLANVTGLAARPTVHNAWRVIVTFTLITAAWVFFRANSVHDAVLIIQQSVRGVLEFAAGLARALTGGRRPVLGISIQMVLFGALLIALLEWVHLLQRRMPLRKTVAAWPIWSRWALYECMLLGIYLFGAFNAKQFIYFQF